VPEAISYLVRSSTSSLRNQPPISMPGRRVAQLDPVGPAPWELASSSLMTLNPALGLAAVVAPGAARLCARTPRALVGEGVRVCRLRVFHREREAHAVGDTEPVVLEAEVGNQRAQGVTQFESFAGVVQTAVYRPATGKPEPYFASNAAVSLTTTQ